jgi:hypothetical protein
VFLLSVFFVSFVCFVVESLSSFPSSCLGTHCREAPLRNNPENVVIDGMRVAQRQAEPGDQCVPKQELGNEGRLAFSSLSFSCRSCVSWFLNFDFKRRFAFGTKTIRGKFPRWPLASSRTKASARPTLSRGPERWEVRYGASGHFRSHWRG